MRKSSEFRINMELYSIYNDIKLGQDCEFGREHWALGSLDEGRPCVTQ